MRPASDEPVDGSAARPANALAERDLEILEFESHWTRHVGAKEAAIRDRFSLSPARYYQLLGALIDSPLALAHDPMLIKRLQRTRDARLSARGASAPRRNV
ncbi:MAG TPA: DUF3263 domain-containing protein [Plantibacter sp.]|uniref:DUF3263 domain-containing protein n=1 Tax=unclassified Plantibacter TaxID=2624265 RepID=UPI002BA88D3E|nr:DUF3263 domain-containing protein [Plantibacter sp.]